ncbi:hypothetical protein ASPZODRAFT_155053 [Penicilliopsis zonata CBS 506.65]|uniref:ribonuclease H n=1 Tax=Penicilliopsis zonata CBS 506.65 TaxID=1073090 RepID=A0A1L9S6J7_9EURO|nr:hypothetical protein ASPZODRAFT_155053 [Penicilliopsis zonata CBS 506.65]OJJ42789.1 hypothetical protein ASPZODRAFT_155053 [Penicilliopsis zonata CBS 506.65]
MPIRHRVGTGRVIPTKFKPPHPEDTPKQLFPVSTNMAATPPVTRFIRRTDKTQLLIYTDGACLDNGGTNPRAGCAFVFKPSTTNPRSDGYTHFALESKGPTGDPSPQTSNRAELRAVIGALRFRAWEGEGFKSLVIATDSGYVVDGITEWVRGWIRRRWTTSMGKPVKNQDLWQCLLGEMERWDERGLQVLFWQIPRDLNGEADRYAKEGAQEEQPEEFMDISGVLV